MVIKKCSVLKPTWKECKNFKKYINKLIRNGEPSNGASLIQAPDELLKLLTLKPKQLKLINFEAFNRQKVSKSPYRGIYNLTHDRVTPHKSKSKSRSKLRFTLKDYKLWIRPTNDANITNNVDDVQEKISSIWCNLTKRSPYYASDIDYALFPDHLEEWNINRFTSKQSLLHRMVKEGWMRGIHTSYLYIGSEGSLFSFHVEDQNTNSINYVHQGAIKVWYAVAEKHGIDFENMCKNGLVDYSKCNMPMRHKTVFVDRSLLEAAAFPVTEVIQRPGQFVITWCGAYHGGFNLGFNIAEASNFGSREWKVIGPKFVDCHCSVAVKERKNNQRPNLINVNKLRKTPTFKRGTYTKKKHHECRYCKKTWSRKSNLVAHISNVHLQTHCFQCKLCINEAKTYTIKASLQKHLNNHHDSVHAYENVNYTLVTLGLTR